MIFLKSYFWTQHSLNINHLVLDKWSVDIYVLLFWYFPFLGDDSFIIIIFCYRLDNGYIYMMSFIIKHNN